MARFGVGFMIVADLSSMGIIHRIRPDVNPDRGCFKLSSVEISLSFPYWTEPDRISHSFVEYGIEIKNMSVDKEIVVVSVCPNLTMDENCGNMY